MEILPEGRSKHAAAMAGRYIGATLDNFDITPIAQTTNNIRR